MKKQEAINNYEKMTYDLAKSVAKISDIYQKVKYINEQMNWDGMFEVDFGEALEKLANVQSAMITYSMEDKFRKSDIESMESNLNALKELENNEE